MVYKIGENITLEDGMTVKLLAVHDGYPQGTALTRCFVEYPHPVDIRLGQKGHPLSVIIKGIRAWVPAPKYTVLRDKDGVDVGIACPLQPVLA